MKAKKPYLFDAMYKWINDSGMTPHVLVDALYDGVEVPMEYVIDGKIVLNIDEDSIDDLSVDEQALSFHAYFGEHDYKMLVFVPMQAVLSIFPEEEYFEGITFEDERDSFTRKVGAAAKKKILQKMAVKKSRQPSSSDKKSKPTLKIVKD